MSPDALISSLFIKSKKNIRPFSNNYFKKFILENLPNFLYIRNCIGSPSNIIFHKKFSIYKYRSDLKWLVDTNYYNKIFNNQKYFIIYGIFDIISYDNATSITNSLKVNLIAKHERKMLKIKYKISYLIIDLFWYFLK